MLPKVYRCIPVHATATRQTLFGWLHFRSQPGSPARGIGLPARSPQWGNLFDYTPEMNPIEQIWKELRQIGFRNEIFATLDKVVDRLCASIDSLSKSTIMSIAGREWILRCFN